MCNSLGSRIKKARVRVKLSQERLAELCDMTEQSINKYENERSTPNVDVLSRMVKHLDCNPGWLLTGDGPMLLTSNLADEGDMLKQSVLKIYDEPPVPYGGSGIDKAHVLTSKIMTSKHPEIAGALMKNLEQFAVAVDSADELATCQIMLKEQDKKIKEMDMKIKGLQDQVSELLRREPPKNSDAPGDINQSSKEVAI